MWRLKTGIASRIAAVMLCSTPLTHAFLDWAGDPFEGSTKSIHSGDSQSLARSPFDDSGIVDYF